MVSICKSHKVLAFLSDHQVTQAACARTAASAGRIFWAADLLAGCWLLAEALHPRTSPAFGLCCSLTWVCFFHVWVVHGT